jgi:surfeit locus 1 family protein
MFGMLTLVFLASFVTLGTWQIYRLERKLDLISSINQRIHAAPSPLPTTDKWPTIDSRAEYLRVTEKGHFLHQYEALVYASTILGPGYWVLTPMRRADGFIVYINRGFVPLDRKNAATRATGQNADNVTVTGLLRINEPGGTLLRSNVPAEGRWYSRDVIAMAGKDGLSNVAPFFIDADAQPNPGGLPVGGLTEVHFPNNHLSYALTWYGMAALSLVGGYLLIRSEMRRGMDTGD